MSSAHLDALRQAWNRVLSKVPEENPEGTNFFREGGDSLAAVELVSAFEESTGQAFPVEVLFTSGSFDDVAFAISGTSAPRG